MTTKAASLFAPPPLFESSEPSLLAPLKAQGGLIYDRYKPKHPADRWLPRTQPPLRSSGLAGNSSPLASTLVTLDAPQRARAAGVSRVGIGLYHHRSHFAPQFSPLVYMRLILALTQVS